MSRCKSKSRVVLPSLFPLPLFVHLPSLLLLPPLIIAVLQLQHDGEYIVKRMDSYDDAEAA